jgi:hypothetical protein
MSYFAIVGYFQPEVQLDIPAWIVALTFVTVPSKFAFFTFFIYYFYQKDKHVLGV